MMRRKQEATQDAGVSELVDEPSSPSTLCMHIAGLAQGEGQPTPQVTIFTPGPLAPIWPRAWAVLGEPTQSLALE